MYKTTHFKRIGIFTLLTVFIAHLFLLAPSFPVQAAGQARIHYIALPGSTIAVLLECNGKFGMVDSGEDTDYPDGTDPRYPWRPGITTGIGYEDEVISYLHSAGVTQDNFEFYIGTHPHSDHIGSADEVIRTFHPKRVYIQEYKDSYITSAQNLWDNLYVYDHMLEAASEVGATIIQNFSNDVPLYPEKVFIQGSVIWDDENDLDGRRPDHVLLTLQGPDNEILQEITVSPDDKGNWNYQTEPLQKYDETKNPIVYQVSMNSLDHYEIISFENTYSFLCTHIPAENTEPENPVPENTETEEKNLENNSDDMTLDENVSNDITTATAPGEDSDNITADDIFQSTSDNTLIESMDENVPHSNGTDIGDRVPESEAVIPPDGGIFDDFSDTFDNTGSSDNLFTDHIPLSDQVDSTCTLDPNNVLSARTAEPAAPAQEGAFEDLSNTQSTVSTPNFTLGDDMLIQIKHYGNDYQTDPKPDANYFSLGVLVECNGRSAFLSGDINNYEGTETALIDELGQVDILTLGHHGNYGSNTYGYVTSLTPQIIVCPGRCNAIPSHTGTDGDFSTMDALLFMAQKGTPLYSVSWYSDYCQALVFCFDETLSKNIPLSVSSLLVSKGLDSEDYLYYLDGFPTTYTGWVDFRENKYYFENSVYPERGRWLSLEGRQYYLNSDATLATGWLKSNNNCYYLDSSGAMLTDWQIIDGEIYYFYPQNGVLLTGWQSIDHRKYYFSPQDGIMKTGWQFIKNKWYYLSPGSGDMKTGWQLIKNKWYYLSPGSGDMKTGWQFIKNKWYYLSPGSGDMKTGWQFIKNKWYYLSPGNGDMKTGWQLIKNKWYYLSPGSGDMKTGWQFIKNKWYYLFPGSGDMKTGWQFIKNKWYYLSPGSGDMKTGWQFIKGNYYYLYPSGAMAADTRINGHYVNRSGKWIP